MGPSGGQRWTTSVVVLEDCEERGLVANIGDTRIVEVVQAADKGIRATKQGDELSLVMWNEAAYA